MSQIKVIAGNYRKVVSVVMEWFQKERAVSGQLFL